MLCRLSINTSYRPVQAFACSDTPIRVSAVALTGFPDILVTRKLVVIKGVKRKGTRFQGTKASEKKFILQHKPAPSIYSYYIYI